jgi:hypothetical protein
MPLTLKKYLIKNRVLFLWIGTIVITSISFLTVYYKIRPQESPDSPVALHYNVVVGVDLYGKGINLFLIPLASLVIAAVNFTVYYMMRRRQRFLADMAVVISFFVSLILLLAIVLLLRVN